MARFFQYQNRAEPVPIPAVAAVVAVAIVASEVFFPRSIIYQAKAEPVQVSEQVTVDKWFKPLSEPVKVIRRLPAGEQQSLAFQFPVPVPPIGAVSTYLEGPPSSLRVLQYQSVADPVYFSDRIVVGVPAPTDVNIKFTRLLQYPAKTEPVLVPPTVTPWNTMVEGATGLRFQKTLVYQPIAEAPLVTAPDYAYHQPWSQPVRVKPRVRFQQNLAWSTFTPSATPAVTAVEPATATSSVSFPRSVIYQSLAWCPQTITPPTFTYFNMTEGDTGLTFRKSIIYQVNTQPVQSVAETITEDKWHQPWSQPIRLKRGLGSRYQQSLAWCPQTIVPPVVTIIPYVEGDTGLFFQKTIIYQESAQAESPDFIFTYQPWSQPVRKKPGLGTWQQRDLFWSGFTPVVVPPTTAVEPTTLTSQVTFPRSVIYQSVAWAPYPIAVEVIYEDKWHQPWSIPVRKKPGIGAWEQRDLFWSGFTPLITEDRWHQPWSEPVRFKRGLRADKQQSFAFHPTPIITFGYYGWLTEPVRLKKGLRANLQQAFTAAPAYPNLPTTAPWYAPLSEPVRQKKGLWARLQSFFTAGTAPIATVITVTLDATETNNDVASIFAVVYNPPVTAYVSIKEVPGSDPTYASIEEI